MFAKKKTKEEVWRDEIVPRKDFQCACGCGLQLSRGDLANAISSALPFSGAPRTWGVTYTKFPMPRDGGRDADEPVEKGECPKCGESVDLPVFAAKLLADRKAAWPTCAECRSGSKPKTHHAKDYWE